MAESHSSEPLPWRRIFVVLGSAIWLLIFISLAIPLVVNRHYQVDEFQESYNSYLLLEPSLRELTLHPQPFMVPLGYLAHHLDGTSEILFAFRLIFLLVLVVNLVLAACVQPFFPRPDQRLVCLVALSGFATFWRHGLEIRHDNLGLTGCLLLYWLTVRTLLGARRRQPMRDIGAGIAFSWLLISAHKGFVLAIPFLALFLWVAGQRHGGILGAFLRSTLGMILHMVPLSLFLMATGTSACILNGVKNFFHHLGDVERFSPWPRILQIASSYPHVTCLAVTATLAAFWKARRRPWRLTASTLSSCYLLYILVFLEINQKPYEYNYLYLMPFGFFSALDGARYLGRALHGRLPRAIAATMLVAATVLGGTGLWQRDPYYRLENRYQLSYIEAAESMTDPQNDSILDGVGMVLTRRPPLRDWQLHGSFMKAYFEGRRQSFAELIVTDPPPIVLTNYRWSSLYREQSLLNDRYLQIANDFWLLGGPLAEGSGDLTIYRSGRYKILAETRREVQVDGEPLEIPAIIHLARGSHRVEGSSAGPIVVHWIGPAEDFDLLPLPPNMELLRGGL